MRKSKRIIGLLMVCVMAVLCVFAMTSCGEKDDTPPQRFVVDDADDYRIVRVVYNTKFAEGEHAPELLMDYDSEAILECLSRYEEFRSENNYAGYNSEDVQLELVIVANKEAKVVLLGNNVNCSHEGGDELEYSIANGEALRAELLAILGK